MSEAHEIRLKRLRYQSWHRGTKELDLLLGPFADDQLGRMSARELDVYEALLAAPEPRLYAWIIGADDPTEAGHATVLEALRAHVRTHTRAHARPRDGR